MKRIILSLLLMSLLSFQGCTPKHFMRMSSVFDEEQDGSNTPQKTATDAKDSREEKYSHGDTFTNKYGMMFVYIGPGSFTMGSPLDEGYRDPDEHQHSVTLTQGFWLQTTEVTQKQWQKIMLWDPYRVRNSTKDSPVTRVSWDDVKKFIKKINRRSEGNVYRLPTEAEWEYACRAGTQTPFSFGDCLSFDQANFNSAAPTLCCLMKESIGKAVSVASYPPNPWGLYDMHGNVWEWCEDRYADYSPEAAVNPSGPALYVGQMIEKGSKVEKTRVIRGGCWINDACFCRSAYRFKCPEDTPNSSIGFRLAADG